MYQIAPPLEVGFTYELVFIQRSLIQRFLGFEQSGACIGGPGAPTMGPIKGATKKLPTKTGSIMHQLCRGRHASSWGQKKEEPDKVRLPHRDSPRFAQSPHHVFKADIASQINYARQAEGAVDDQPHSARQRITEFQL